MNDMKICTLYRRVKNLRAVKIWIIVFWVIHQQEGSASSNKQCRILRHEVSSPSQTLGS
jgi:hypothetical protein